MQKHSINGVDFWTPTEAEKREAIASSLNHMAGGWDLAEQAARPGRLNALYEADGRHNPHHPYHGVFTGLVVGFPDQFAPVEE